MNKIFTSIFVALAMFGANAANFYVDGSKADDTGNGQSWATAKKTLNATIAGSAAGDNIFVKAGTYTYTVSNPASTTYALSTTADRNYYGGFAGTETDPSQRILTDFDENGITEPWEFANPTILNISLDNTTNNNARGLNIISNTAQRVFDGFKIAGSQTYSCTTATSANILCITLNNFVLFRNNTVSDWSVTGTINYAAFAMDALLIKTAGGAGVIDNCLFENNTITITAGNAINTDVRQSPFIRLNNASASGANAMRNSVIRKNQVKVDYTNASTITGCSNVRGMLVEVVTAVSPYYTVFKNNLVYNNDLTFVPRSGQTFSAANGAAVYTYTGSNTNSDSIVNNTIAKNKLVKMSRALVVGFSNATQPYHVVANNVVYDNTNDGNGANIVLGVVPSGTPSGIYIANNISNGFGLDQASYSGNVYVVNNLNDLANDNANATKGAKFTSVSSFIGYNADASVASSNWKIGAGSYLIAKGVVTANKYDKSGVLFSTTTPAVGAYEYVYNPGTGFSKTSEFKYITVVSNGLICNENGSLQILTIGGQTIYTKQVQAGNRISLASGAYIIRMISDKGMSVQKVIL